MQFGQLCYFSTCTMLEYLVIKTSSRVHSSIKKIVAKAITTVSTILQCTSILESAAVYEPLLILTALHGVRYHTFRCFPHLISLLPNLLSWPLPTLPFHTLLLLSLPPTFYFPLRPSPSAQVCGFHPSKLSSHSDTLFQ